MTTLGPHLKIVTHAAHRAALRDALPGALGLEPLAREERFDAYRLGDGSLGYFFVDDPADALSPADARKGAWIELVVDDLAATRAALSARGLEPFIDGRHTYVALPGGQVARLVPRG